LKRWVRGLLIFAAVVFLLYVAVFTIITQPWNPRVLNQNLLNQCSASWPPESPGPNISQREQFAVLLANPGTSPKLCVGYGSLVDSQVSLQLDALVVPLNSSLGTITVLAEPHNLTVPNDNNGNSPTGIAYAVFTLQISNGSRGFYVLDLPGDCPRLLAVAYPPAQINESDFGKSVHDSLSCTGNPQVAPDVTVQFEGESNLNITYPYVS
jgi:hypothetical protein